jgi:hypothetical protein
MRRRKLTDRELATVLAALRVYQQALAMNGDLPPRGADEIATDCGELEPMGADEIDALCESINLGEIA